jgi:histidyl-tRNA synthetase
MGIEYSVNPKIVRGLDYYTKTVFEFVTTDIGAQGTVCGGGRYDGLIEQLSGKHVPALGFGMGLERLILTMESQGCDFMESPTCDLYIATMGETAKDKAVQLVSLLREEGYLVEYDLMDRGIKAQMKYANKLKSKFVVVLGDNEIESQTAKLKDMASGEETPITLGEKFLESFSSVYMANMMSFED